jgi:hypothetical protein
MDLMLVKRKMPPLTMPEHQALKFLTHPGVIGRAFEASVGIERFKTIAVFNGMKKMVDPSMPLMNFYTIILTDLPSVKSMAENVLKVHWESLPLTDIGKTHLKDILKKL